MRRTAAVLAALLAALVAFAGPASAAPSSSTSTSTSKAIVISAIEMTNASLADCDAGEVCFYTETNQTGSMCHWSGDDKNWYAAPVVCSWTNSKQVKSMYNHGQDTAYKKVSFYRDVNWLEYNGCMGRGWYGNIGPVYLRPHSWDKTAC